MLDCAMADDILDDRSARQIVSNGHILSALYLARVPAAHASPDWETFLLACLARSHYTLQTILEAQHRELDCAVLARVLYEHVVALAWVAIDPVPHYPMFLRWEYNEREKMRKDLESFVSIAPGEGTVRRSLIDMGPISAPATPDRALAADKFWSRCVTDWEWGLRRTYANLFRPYSSYTHPTVMGLTPFVSHTGLAVNVGPPALMHNRTIAVETVTIFADGLVVASHRLGWPTLKEVVSAFAHGLSE